MWDLGGYQAFVNREEAYRVLIVGGASGIGRSTATLLADFGAHVAIADRSGEAAGRVAAEIETRGGKAVSITLDVSDAASIVAGIETATAFFGGAIHAVINTAGITGETNIAGHLVDLADFDRVCAVNLRGAMALSQAVLPMMLSEGYGRILHVASIAGKEGNAGMAAYSASKAGLIGLVKSLAKDCATSGVTINTLAPAVIRTPLVDALPQATVDYMTAKIPMGRCGTLDEAARMAAFIISPACAFTTGAVFDLSGGRATY